MSEELIERARELIKFGTDTDPQLAAELLEDLCVALESR